MQPKVDPKDTGEPLQAYSGKSQPATLGGSSSPSPITHASAETKKVTLEADNQAKQTLNVLKTHGGKSKPEADKFKMSSQPVVKDLKALDASIEDLDASFSSHSKKVLVPGDAKTSQSPDSPEKAGYSISKSVAEPAKIVKSDLNAEQGDLVRKKNKQKQLSIENDSTIGEGTNRHLIQKGGIQKPIGDQKSATAVNDISLGDVMHTQTLNENDTFPIMGNLDKTYDAYENPKAPKTPNPSQSKRKTPTEARPKQGCLKRLFGRGAVDPRSKNLQVTESDPKDQFAGKNSQVLPKDSHRDPYNSGEVMKPHQISGKYSDIFVEGCSCAYCIKKRFNAKKIIHVVKDEGQKGDITAAQEGQIQEETIEEHSKHFDKNKKKAEWGQLMLVDDQYPSSNSDEEEKAKDIHERRQQQKFFTKGSINRDYFSNILSKRLNEKEFQLNADQRALLDKMQYKQAIAEKDEKIKNKKRAQMMEIFMDLDKNHDNFVDRKDLIKYYGMLCQIKGASVKPVYKCKKGHDMIPIVHDMNFERKEVVNVKFKKNKQNRQADYLKYNGTKATILNAFNEGSNEQSCKTNDGNTHYFNIVNYGKVCTEDDEILPNPGEPVVCCHDKECPDKPKDRKQSFIFCPKCSDPSGTYNFTVCLQHAAEYEDIEAMKEEEFKKEKESKKTQEDSRMGNLPIMLLFMTIDQNDDGYIQEKEWMQLQDCVVKKDNSKQADKKFKRRVSINQNYQKKLKDKAKSEGKKTKANEEESDKEVENYDDLNTKDNLMKSFKKKDVVEMGYMDFEERIDTLKIDPEETRKKIINKRYAGSKCILKIFKENFWVNSNRRIRALKKLEIEYKISPDIKKTFEKYFKNSDESKMDLFDFYKIMEKCEVDIDQSSKNLFEQHFKSRISIFCCKNFCRNRRNSQAMKHVDTFDQIEAEKHRESSNTKTELDSFDKIMKQTKQSSLTQQDSLSKVIIVYMSVIQFGDLITDAILLWQMYQYSYIRYTPCTPKRIDWSDDLKDGVGDCKVMTEGYDASIHEALGYEPYDDDNEASYKTATTIMLISMFSTYLVAYSSIIKLLLDTGSFEPHIIKQNPIIVIVAKFMFLSFLGPFYIMFIELLSTCMAFCQMYALLATGFSGYDHVRSYFMNIFENILMLDEERADGLKQQRSIAQLFFENMPLIFIQTLIQLNILKCKQLQEGSSSTLMFSYTTTLISCVACLLDITLQAKALDEVPLVFCLNCLQARQGWIPFLHQISTNNLKRDAYDYGRIVCSYPAISARSLYYKFFKFQFTDVSLNALISELATMGLMLERKNEKREKLKIYIGRSTNLVTLETVLHVYQLVMQQEDIEINLDGIKWERLIKNSKRKLLIPTTNDVNKVYTDTIETSRITNEVRIKNVQNFQKIKTYESRTPAGNYSLWICADDENKHTEKVDKHEKEPLWQHYSRMKRLAIDNEELKHKTELQLKIKSLEEKRNHLFDIDAQIDEEQKDGKFLKSCITIQRRFRGHNTRKFFNINQKKNTRTQLLKRSIIELLNIDENKGDKKKQLKALQERFELKKVDVNELQSKVDILKQNRDRDNLTKEDREKQHKEAEQDYRNYQTLHREQRERMDQEDGEVRTLLLRAQSGSISNNKIFAQFYEFEMQAPTRECYNIITYLYAVLRGEDSLESLKEDPKWWQHACEMMSKSKRLADETYNFSLEKMHQWKVDLIQEKVDNFELDEQVMVTHSEALALVCVWLTSIVDAFKFSKSFQTEKKKYEKIKQEYHDKEKTYTGLDSLVEAARKALQKSQALLTAEENNLNDEKDDLAYISSVIVQIKDASSVKEQQDLSKFPEVDHLYAQFKNEKLEKPMMCSYANCVKVFGSIDHLKYHYKVSHPDAIFEVDFPEPNKDGVPEFIALEQEKTRDFLDKKKKMIKEDVEYMKKTFVKKQTLFKMISDNYKENEDYDPIFHRERRVKRKQYDLDFYQAQHLRKIEAIRWTQKEKLKSSGHQELIRAEKAVKNSFKQIDAIKKESLEDILEQVNDKENAKQGLLKQVLKVKEIEVDETQYLHCGDQNGAKIKDKNFLKDSKSKDYFETYFMKDETWILFKFHEPMMLSHYEMVYAGLDRNYHERGAGDPDQWKVCIRSAIYPYKSIEIEHTSKYLRNSQADEARAQPGEGEIFYFEEKEYLTQEVKIVIKKIRQNQWKDCKDISLQGLNFYGNKPQYIPDTKQFEESINALKLFQATEDYKHFYDSTKPSQQMLKLAQMMCILLQTRPNKKDRKQIDGDKQGFFQKTKVTTLKSFDDFIKSMSEVEKDNIPDVVEKKIKKMIDQITKDKQQDENPLIESIKNWAQQVLNYSDDIKKAQKSLSLDDINVVEKVIFAVMIITQRISFDDKRKGCPDAMIKQELTNLKIVDTAKSIEWTKIPKEVLRRTKRIVSQEGDLKHDNVKKINFTMSVFVQWILNVQEYYNAEKTFQENSKKTKYTDFQISEKEKAIKEIKMKREKLATKKAKLDEDETIIKKNLIVKNKNWTLEGCMKVLLDDGCDPNIKDNSGETLLIDAIKKKKLKTIELLLENDCKVTARNDQGMSPIGQAVTSMNHEALEIILKNSEQGQNSIHEAQIYDKTISHKILTPVHYICKLIRLRGLKSEYSKMLEILVSKNVKCEEQAEKRGVFRQFCRLFSTFGIDQNFNSLYYIMEQFSRFNPQMLTQRDSKKNNFLHLISKNFIYKVGDTPHPNYDLILSTKLDPFCDGGFLNTLKTLLVEQNFQGIAPLKMMLDNNQYGLIKILCEKQVVDKFETAYEEDIVNYLLRFAQVAVDGKTDFDPRVIMFMKHFEPERWKNKWGKEFTNDRLVPMVIERGILMVKKNPALTKQFNSMKILGNKDHTGLYKNKPKGKKKDRGKSQKRKTVVIQEENADLEDDDDFFGWGALLGDMTDEEDYDSESDSDENEDEDENEKQGSDDNDEAAAAEFDLDTDSDEDEKVLATMFKEEEKKKLPFDSDFVRVNPEDTDFKQVRKESLKKQMEVFRQRINVENVEYKQIEMPVKSNEYIELLFNLVLELIALFDMSGDFLLLIALFKSQHTGWFCFSLLSMLSPFFVCYVPLLTFQKKKLNNRELDWMDAIITAAFLTPLVLIYLNIMDVVYIFTSVVLVPIAVMIQWLTCGLLSERNMAHYFEEKLDSIYEVAFGMSQMDIKGFRRLRTISQLSFESMPQILIQGRILYYNYFNPESKETLDVDIYVLLGSLTCAALHAIVEGIFVSLEARACKTTLMHYCIVCFNARFGWIPFQNLFQSVSGTSEEEFEDDEQDEDYEEALKNKMNIDYENIRSRLFRQEFDVDFAFSQSTAQTLINCISKLPTEEDSLKRKNVFIGKSMNDVDMDKLIDLVEMANKRVNIFIEGIDVRKLLQKRESEHILNNILTPKKDEKGENYDSLLLKMIKLGRSHIVKQMLMEKAETDLNPKPFQVAVDSKSYEMCQTLVNENNDDVNQSIRSIKNNRCQFKEYLELAVPEVTAALFSNKNWLICESYQLLVLNQIIDGIRERELDKSFQLMKALCGPNIPYHLIRGIGMQLKKDDGRNKYHSIVEDRKKQIDEYRQHRETLVKFQKAFPKHVYVITEASKYKINEAQNRECIHEYKPFPNKKGDKEASVEKLNKLKIDEKDHGKYLGQDLMQILKLTAEEAYSFSVIRQLLIQEPMSYERSQNDKTAEEKRIGQMSNPVDISEYELDPVHIMLVTQLISDNYAEVPSLSREDIAQCDIVVQKLNMDRLRAAYFARSRQFDQTDQMPSKAKTYYEDKKFYFDENWQKVANLDQVKYNQMVLHPYLEKYKSHVADLRWVQVLFEDKVPDDAIAIKSFMVKIESYRSIISLNLIKPQYQTSYIISNETEKTESNECETYFEQYVERIQSQESLPYPDGFKDVISSAEKGDTIQILMSRTKKSMKVEQSSYVKNLQIELSFIKKLDDFEQSREQGSEKKVADQPSASKKFFESINFSGKKADDDSDDDLKKIMLKTEELLISKDTDINELRLQQDKDNKNPAHKKLFPLLDFVENSKISVAEDLNYFESFFALGNMSELSKSMTPNMWDRYKDKTDTYGNSFKDCIFPGIKLRDTNYGVCAFSKESYQVFQQLFESIILKIHRKSDHRTKDLFLKGDSTYKVIEHNLEAKKAQDRKKEQVEFWTERRYNHIQEKMVSQIKANIRRNIKGYPLVPGLRKFERTEIMNNVKKACLSLEKFDPNLKGTFLEIANATDQDKEKLGDLIKKIDNEFSELCQINNEWPHGRAIFYNEDLSFIVQVNREDQVEIEYKMQEKSIDDFFTNHFNEVSKHLDEALDFDIDDKLGCITTLPANLGTSLKVQVILKVPNLKNKTALGKLGAEIQSQRESLKEMIKENENHDLNIKGDLDHDGEPSEIGKTLDQDDVSILTVEKIGTSMRDAVHRLNVSINILIDRENMYMNKMLIKEKQKLQSYEHLFVVKPGEFKPTGLQKYMTKKLWDKYRDEGFTSLADQDEFMDCVYPGIKETSSDMILCAASQQSYQKFDDLFNPLIKELHGVNFNQNKVKSQMDWNGMKDCDYQEASLYNIDSVKISLKRNMKDIPFGSNSKLTPQQREDILKNVEAVSEKFDEIAGQEFQGQFYNLGKISVKDKRDLGNMPLSINDGTTIIDENFQKAALLQNDWPNGRALYVGKSNQGGRSFIMKLNYVDHLEIQIEQKKVTYVTEIETVKPPMYKGGRPTISIQRLYSYDYCNVFEGYQKLCQVTQLMEDSNKFSHSDQLGYLTTLPKDLGYFEMTVVLTFMPNIYKMIKNVKKIEDFAHYEIIEKYQVEVTNLTKWGSIEVKPKVVDQKKVIMADKIKLDTFEEPLMCMKSHKPRHCNSLSRSSMYPRYYDLETQKGFNRFNKNEKMMAQDVISAVKELTEQEQTYKNMSDLNNTYAKCNKYYEVNDYDSIFIEKDAKAHNYWDGDQSLPPFVHFDSRLSRVMTRDIWNEYKNQKCEKGTPFKMCIFPDLKIRQNTLGLVAGSNNCYQKFDKLFYNYIKEFHNFQPNAKKVPKSRFLKESIEISKSVDKKFEPKKKSVLPILEVQKSYISNNEKPFENLNFSETNKRMILKINFEVRRNLSEYPFAINMRLNERVKLMKEVYNAALDYEMDLKGKFYRLKFMSQRNQSFLKDVLFKRLERQFIASGGYYEDKKDKKEKTPEMIDSEHIDETNLMSDWPYGRAIYVNEDKSFIINVGNIDHLEIKSQLDRNVHKTCDINQAFKTLMRGTAHLDKRLSFARDENVGYTTSIMKNLGVLDFSIEFMPKYYKFYSFRMTPDYIAKTFNIKCEEHGDESRLTLVNLIKFGMDETQIVQNLINCLHAFFAYEDEYKLKFDVDYQIPQYIDSCILREVSKDERNKNLAKYTNFEEELRAFHIYLKEDKKYVSKFDQILTKEIWDLYFDQVCIYQGNSYSFKDSIINCIQNFAKAGSEQLLVAGSQSAYRRFGELYARALHHYKDERADAFEQSLSKINIQLPNDNTKRDAQRKYQEYTGTDFEKDDDELVKSIKIVVRRNLENYPLAPAMLTKHRNEVRDKIINVCKKFQGPLKTSVYKNDEFNKPTPKTIQERKDEFTINEDKNGPIVNKQYPQGRAIIYNSDKSLMVVVNEVDHVEISFQKSNKGIQETLNEFTSQILNKFDAECKFAFDEQLGYITARPYDLGFISIEIQVELPDLALRAQNLEDHLKEKHILFPSRKFNSSGGSYGENNRVYLLSNAKKERGHSEKTQIQGMVNCMHEVFNANKKYVRYNKIKKVENLVDDFDQIFPPIVGSKQHQLVQKKIITEEIWKKYKGKKCSDKGVSFEHNIYPGFVEVNKSANLICATSEEAYETFSEIYDNYLFQLGKSDKEIQEGKKDQIDLTKQKEFVCGGFQNIEIQPEFKKDLKRIRIAVQRNISGFPLIPAISKKQRTEVMDIVETCCKEFDDDLKGTFYKLEDISESDKKMISDLIFKQSGEGSFENFANQGKDWPSGRAIFANLDKNLVIQVNNEDHMSIVFSQEDVTIEEFLERFMEILSKIQLHCKFQFSTKYGYLKSFPYILKHLSFHIEIDDAKDVNHESTEVQRLVHDLNCNIRRRDTNGYLSITNKRLNSEQECIQQVIYMTQEILKKRKYAQDMKDRYDDELAEAKNLKTFDVFMSKKNMEMATYLTKEMWDEYYLMTDDFNVPFKDIIYPGVKDLDDKTYTLCASSLSCYKLYHLLFEKYMRFNHRFWRQKANHPEMVSVSFENNEFKPADIQLVQRVKFQVRRNYAKYPIGPGVTKVSRKQVMDMVDDLCKTFVGANEGTFYKLDGIKKEDKDIIDYLGIEKKDDSYLNVSGIYDDWPEHRAVFVNTQKTLSIKVNFLDHLEISFQTDGTGFMESLVQFQDILYNLETKCRFAHDQKLGYITTLPKLINYMRIEIRLQIHEKMLPHTGGTQNQSNDNQGYSNEDNLMGTNDTKTGTAGTYSYKSYQTIMRDNKFKCTHGEESKQKSGHVTQYLYNIIENEHHYGMTEQDQLQNAITTLQDVFDLYAPKRKFNPFIEQDEED